MYDFDDFDYNLTMENWSVSNQMIAANANTVFNAIHFQPLT